jgi:hypothetical protein
MTRTHPTEPDAIAERIALTRQQLGETIEQLSARLDVKARARESLAQGRERMIQYAVPAATVAVLATGTVVLLLVLRRRNRR